MSGNPAVVACGPGLGPGGQTNQSNDRIRGTNSVSNRKDHTYTKVKKCCARPEIFVRLA